MRFNLWFLFILPCFLFYTNVMGAPRGKIYSTALEQEITKEELISFLNKADIVLLGEVHDQLSHHKAQQWLLKNIKVESVVLEMLDEAQEARVAKVQDFLQKGGYLRQSALADKLDWNHAWDWALYGDLMNQIMRDKARVLAGNPSVNRLNQAEDFLQLGTYTKDELVQKALADLIMQHHHIDDDALKIMIKKQQLKDQTMAKRLLSARKPAWLLAGNIHVSKRLGVPLFLKDFGVADEVLVLILTDPNATLDFSHGDYFWYLED